MESSKLGLQASVKRNLEDSAQKCTDEASAYEGLPERRDLSEFGSNYSKEVVR